MTNNIEILPEFNANLILGMLLSFAPHRLSEHSARIFVKRLMTLHPRIKQRLCEADGKSFAFVMPDMPFNMLIYLNKGTPDLSLTKTGSPVIADVTISGTSATLLSLLEGSTDGDALFFSRALRVAGDTEALLVLRNAIDNEHIDLRKITLSLFGPLSGAAARIISPIEKISMRFVADMARLHESALAPIRKEQFQLAHNIEKRFAEIETMLATLQTRSRKNG